MRSEKTMPLAEKTYKQTTAAYTSAEFLDRERAGLFRGRPLFVGLSSDAAGPGDYFTTYADGLPLVIVRGEDGLLRALVNACRHRGAEVFTGRGRLPGRGVSCPFHSWTYDMYGRLLGQPLAQDGFAGHDSRDLALRPLVALERHGLVFVVPTAIGKPGTTTELDDLIGPAGDELAGFGFDRYAHVESRTRTRALNWKLVMDSFMESYHIFALHRKSISQYYFSTPSVFAAFGRTGRLIGVRSDVLELANSPESEWSLLPYSTIQYFLPPNGILVHQVDHVETWQVFPGRCPAESVIVTSVYAPPDSTRDEDYYRRNLDVLLSVTDNEDFVQGERIQAALDSGALNEIVFGRNEPALIHYHQALDEMLA